MKKVIVCGPYNAGKTTFVRNINKSEFIGTDEPEVDVLTLAEKKTMTTVGIELNFLRLGKKEVMFMGVPGQFKFTFIWDIIAEQFDGIVFIFPSYISCSEAFSYIEYFSKFESYKKAYKLVILSYPERLKEEDEKIYFLNSCGLQIKLANLTDEVVVKSIAFEIANKV